MFCSRDVAVLLSLQSEMWEFGTGEYKKIRIGPGSKAQSADGKQDERDSGASNENCCRSIGAMVMMMMPVR
jgi:hypothetical protein